jgi:hypothetical protein
MRSVMKLIEPFPRVLKLVLISRRRLLGLVQQQYILLENAQDVALQLVHSALEVLPLNFA